MDIGDLADMADLAFESSSSQLNATTGYRLRGSCCASRASTSSTRLCTRHELSSSGTAACRSMPLSRRSCKEFLAQQPPPDRSRLKHRTFAGWRVCVIAEARFKEHVLNWCVPKCCGERISVGIGGGIPGAGYGWRSANAPQKHHICVSCNACCLPTTSPGGCQALWRWPTLRHGRPRVLATVTCQPS